MDTTRRDFLLQGTASASLVAAGLSMPGFLRRSAAAATSSAANDRILVIVQLSGGNDGLNTVIPYEDDLYHNARPTLRIASNRVHKLHDQLGLHPDMEAFKNLFDNGTLGVVNNVGYPNPDRSHFRSMDIWHTADNSPQERPVGWLGRLADARQIQGQPPVTVHLDNTEVPLALQGESNVAPTITNINDLRLEGDPADLRNRLAQQRSTSNDDLLFVQRVAVESCDQATRLQSVASENSRAGSYPGYGLAGRLQQIAQLINAGFGASVYYTSIGGFDTHARQSLAHGPLLRELSTSVAAFQNDIEQRGLADRVMLMTFSEFGRRVKENGSRGTDHGAAAPMFVVGRHANAGIHGGPPDLANLTDGDVKHDVDFRRVYTTLLDNWLGIDPAKVVGDFKTMNLIRSS